MLIRKYTSEASAAMTKKIQHKMDDASAVRKNFDIAAGPEKPTAIMAKAKGDIIIPRLLFFSH